MYKNWYEKEADINYRNEMIKASIDILIDKIQDYQWNIDTIKEEILEEKRYLDELKSISPLIVNNKNFIKRMEKLETMITAKEKMFENLKGYQDMEKFLEGIVVYS